MVSTIFLTHTGALSYIQAVLVLTGEEVWLWLVVVVVYVYNEFCLFDRGSVEDGVQLVRLIQGSLVKHVTTLYHVITP